MKPHEEAWEFTGPVSGMIRIREPNGEIKILSLDDDPIRARLASQAPAMARLILKFLKQGDGSMWEHCSTEFEAVLRAAGVIE